MAPKRKKIVTRDITPPKVDRPSTPPRSATSSARHDDNPLSPLSPISPWPPPFHEPDTSDEMETTANTGHVAGTDTLPSAKEIYGSLAILLTSLGYVAYLCWGFLPPGYLDAIGWTWYPAREWAVIIPCYLMLIVLLTYLAYAALTAYITPSFDSPSLITDEYANIPPIAEDASRYYWKLAQKDGMPPAVDIPIDVVNRVLYPPRHRPR